MLQAARRALTTASRRAPSTRLTAAVSRALTAASRRGVAHSGAARSAAKDTAKPSAGAAAPAAPAKPVDYSAYTNKRRPTSSGTSVGTSQSAIAQANSGKSWWRGGRNNQGWWQDLRQELSANPWLHSVLGFGAFAMVCWGVYDTYVLWTQKSSLLPPKSGPDALRPPKPTYRLKMTDQVSENALWESSCQLFAGLPLSSALAKLETHLDKPSHKLLSDFVAAHPHVLTAADLNRVCGYFELMRAHNIPVVEAPLQIRVELTDASADASADAVAGRVYVVTSVAHSLIQRLPTLPGVGTAETDGAVLFWTHDHAWATERFLSKPHGPAYLCGQTLGRSKFVSAGKIDANWSKQELVTALGLDGYAYGTHNSADEPRYVVAVTPYKALVDAMAPAVPLIYKTGTKKPASATATADADAAARNEMDALQWKTADNFGRATIPGYTAGGLAEVVVNTIEVSASGLDDLARKGVRLYTFK